MNWDTGMTEVRFFGHAKSEVPPESGPVTCGSRRLFELRDAVLDHCAQTKSRPTAECARWITSFEWCHQADIQRELKWLPISEESWSGSRLELMSKDTRNPPFPSLGATFVRDGDGRWRVEKLTCLRGKTACGLAHRVGSDSFDVSDPEKLTPLSCWMLDGRILNVDGKVIVPVTP